MLKYVIASGVCYGSETADDMIRREKKMAEYNAKVDAIYADEQRQRRTPMPSMIKWAEQRGISSQ